MVIVVHATTAKRHLLGMVVATRLGSMRVIMEMVPHRVGQRVPHPTHHEGDQHAVGLEALKAGEPHGVGAERYNGAD